MGLTPLFLILVLILILILILILLLLLLLIYLHPSSPRCTKVHLGAAFPTSTPSPKSSVPAMSHLFPSIPEYSRMFWLVQVQSLAWHNGAVATKPSFLYMGSY